MKYAKFKLVFLLAAFMGLSGCFWGEKVQVPPAWEGKVLGKNGYLPESYPPSTFRLAPCWAPGAVCQELVLIDKSDQAVTETFTLFMPENQLNLTFDVRMTGSIQDGKTDAILNRVKPQTTQQGLKYISFDSVYATYAQPIIRDSVRAVVAEFSIDEVISSRDAINAKIAERLKRDLAVTPIALKTVGLADAQYPKVIVERKEMAEQRRIDIEQEEARKQVELIKLQTELEKAKAERSIRREKAEAAAEENRIAATSITPEYLEYKKLEVLDNIAKNGSSVFVPFGALDEVGLSQKVFNQ